MRLARLPVCAHKHSIILLHLNCIWISSAASAATQAQTLLRSLSRRLRHFFSKHVSADEGGHGPRFRRHCSKAAPSPIINVSASHSHTLTSVCPSPVVSVTDCQCVCVCGCQNSNTCDRLPTKQKRGHHTRMYAHWGDKPERVCVCV